MDERRRSRKKGKKRRERERRTEEEERKKGKKDVGFDVESRRILQSNQNEVRSHEPYINQPCLLSSLRCLQLALFIIALTAPSFSPSLSSLIDREARY